jgi:hypothetical protein
VLARAHGCQPASQTWRQPRRATRPRRVNRTRAFEPRGPV